MSGATASIAAFVQQLTQNGITSHLLHISCAPHSPLMEPILAAFIQHVQQICLHPPTIPYISNVTGTWIQTSEATDPHYWAVQIMSKVREALQVSLPPSSLLEAPTLAQFAALIAPKLSNLDQSSQRERPICLVKLQTGHPGKTPLFFVHPAGGSADRYRSLAVHLGAEQPVYGIQYPGLETDREPFIDVSAMATYYVC